ncbi:ABC transporter permease [Candidatus Entotheonella palauensis]|uniref:ABC transporter permease n=1 Tax=Candidatus Entotheonella palauensis TaxID=93172 RepID=UPI000B7F356B|nr:ABC transporter permease [Candidatus Entotheonella palauensis]
MRADYVLRRLGIFVLIVWAAATINFFIPRISGQDPVGERLMKQASAGGYVHAGIEDMVKTYNQKFGLDRPLWQQYLTYLGDVARFDFNYSIANYPQRVIAIIANALPWSIGLLAVVTLFAFAIGSFLGALLAWPKTPRFFLNFLGPPLIMLSAIPYYLLGLILLFILAFQARLLPFAGAYEAGTIPALSWAFARNVLRHAILPAGSIILSAVGFWALGMRAMMISVQREDFMTLGEAKGLKNRTLFLHYAVRNALLPQITSLALSMGYVVSGAVLVEVVFAYPGIGLVLYQAIREVDYTLIQGVLFIIIVAIALSTLILDLILPLLDPRITYRGT